MNEARAAKLAKRNADLAAKAAAGEKAEAVTQKKQHRSKITEAAATGNR